MTIEEYIYENKNRIESFEQNSFNCEKYQREELRELKDFNSFLESFGSLKSIDRETVIKAFKNDKLYDGYVIAMMWGGINTTRPSAKGDYKTTNFYKALSLGKESITQILLEVRRELKAENFTNVYNKLHSGKLSIPGIGESYFTKLLYFIGESENINPVPLIYDKWTKLIHVALLIDSDEEEKLNKFYTSNAVMTAFGGDKVELINSRNKYKATAYVDYFTNLNRIADNIKVNAGDLEAFLFGMQLRNNVNKTDNNPRVWLHNYVKANI